MKFVAVRIRITAKRWIRHIDKSHASFGIERNLMNRESRWLRMEEGDYWHPSGRMDLRVRPRWKPLSSANNRSGWVRRSEPTIHRHHSRLTTHRIRRLRVYWASRDPTTIANDYPECTHEFDRMTPYRGCCQMSSPPDLDH